MRTAIAVADRMLLGPAFAVFGLNGFRHFIPNQPVPKAATNCVRGMPAAHLHTIVVAQLACGGLLPVGLHGPLAEVVIAPVIVNILLFHATVAPSALMPRAGLAGRWAIVAVRCQPALVPLRRPTVRR